MQFTPEQIQAINEKGTNILVSAAAGSGKTSVLAERIISKIINEKINIDSLLVVTFTHSAAEEMKERIIKKINENLKKDTKSLFLQEQLTRINKAQISTIDAFCLKVVKTHFKAIDIDPNFRIGEEAELKILRLEVLEEFLNNYYENRDEQFFKLIDSFTKKADDKSFIEVFLNIYDNSQDSPYPHIWLKNAAKQFNFFTKEDFLQSNTFKKIIMYTKEELLELTYIFEKIKFISTGYLNFQENSSLDGSIESFLTNEFSLYRDMLEYIEKEKYEVFINTITNISYKKWSSKFLKEFPELKEDIKYLRDTAKEVISSLKERFFKKSLDNIVQDNIYVYPLINKFCNLIIEFDKHFMNIKKDKRIFSFNDIAHFCLNILVEDGTPTTIAKEYQNKFKEIIIDEYQDSNSIQEEILSAISHKNKFMVGDIKQCIYRFRQANPQIFNEKFNGYFDHSLDGIRIDLNANFRSNKSVVESINLIFENIMCNEFGNVLYDENSKLYHKSTYPIPKENENTFKKCELCIIDCSKEDTEISEHLSDLQNVEIEAHFIAKKIKSMFSKNTLIFDKEINKYRNIMYKDIVILMRSGNYFDIFSKILTQYNIPVHSKSINGFYDFIEIKTILNILKIIDNPLQDIALIGVMYSPIFNFSANELLEIKIFSQSKLFYNDILFFIDNSTNEELKNKISEFINKLNKWSTLSKSLPINELLAYIYQDSNYYNYLGVLENGNIRQSNLFSLLEKATAFENNNMQSIFSFITYIEKIKTFSKDGETNMTSEDEDIVKIMTIHKSKGLEFPVVFLANLNKSFNQEELKKSIIFDEQYMLGLSIFKSMEDDIIPTRKNISTIQKNLIKYKIKEDSYSEELRILYVALTRAKEKLILSGCINKYFEKSLENMKNLILSSSVSPSKKFLPKYFINNSSSNNFLAWIYSVIENFDTQDIWDFYIESISSILQDTYNEPEEKVNIHKSKLFKEMIISSSKLDANNNIAKNLSWVYPNIYSQSLSATLSVSEIKRIYQKKFLNTENNLDSFKSPNLELPKFYNLSKKQLSSMEIGTIYHKVFENLNFNVHSKDEIEKLLNILVKKNILEEKEITYIDLEKINIFLNTDLVHRIRASSNVKRETAFTIGLNPKDIYSDKEFKNNDTLILVNGIIDLYFEEEDGLVLVDYKTDNIKNENILINNYKVQLDIYKKALENATNKKVKECIIYSIYNSKCIPIKKG